MKDIKKIKTVHIHTDYKFVRSSRRFFGRYFDNSIVIIKSNILYSGVYHESAKYYNAGDIDEIIEYCQKADLVVLYNLDFLKSQIAIALPNDIKVAWRFFGSELYSRMLNEVLSKKTQLYFPEKESFTFLKGLKDLIRPIYRKIKYGGTRDELFYKAIDRIDFMLNISIQEYNYLSSYWENLPEYIELPVWKGLIKGKIFEQSLAKKKNKIVVGNSRNAFNNHLDMINMIEKSNKKKQYQFELLFNYGTEGSYSNAIRRAVQGKSYFKLIEEFMSTEEFYTFYSDKCALVVNSYRQLAMGSIFHALKNGVKVYLNKRNIMMEWFSSKDIMVFPIENLISDLEKHDIELCEEIVCYNKEGLINLYQNYTNEDFQQSLYKKVLSNKT